MGKGLEGDLDDESLRRRFVKVERLEHSKQAFERVQQDSFIVLSRPTVGACDTGT